MAGTPVKEKFKSWINKMPGAAESIIVIGKIAMPTAGWEVSLVKGVQGINPTILILEIQGIEPSGAAAQVITTLDVRFEETPPEEQYTMVTVRSESEEFTFEVEIAR